MKRKSIVSLTVVMGVILLFSLFIVPVASGAKGGTNLPFKAMLAGSAHYEFPGSSPSSCMVATALTEASGQATYMGRVAASFSHCPAEPGYVNDGRMKLIAANGDELYGTYNYDPIIGISLTPVTITGGTGLFVDASGVINITYEVIPQFIPGCNPEPDPFPCYDLFVPWPWSATMTGTINY